MNAIHLLLILIATSLNAQQASTITVFRQPNTDTIARAINNNGVIVGSYTPTNNPTQPAGFRRNPDGTIETILYPNATNTQLNGINDQGEIVGNFANNTRAFLRLPNGTFTEITAPDATLTNAFAINNNGYIVGAFQRINTNRRPFLRDLAAAIHPLADIISGNVDAVAINNGGNRILLSQFQTSFFDSNFASDSSGAFHFLNPWSIGVSGGRMRTLNAGNIFAGDRAGTAFLFRGHLDGVHFRLNNDVSETYIYGMNDKNEIVGAVQNPDNSTSGFLLTPCKPTLSITSRDNGSRAETSEIPLTAPAQGFCLWVADTNAPWIKFNRSIGAGTGRIVYTLEPNTASQPRTGAITVGNSNFTITQASDACQYTVTPNNQVTVPGTGGAFNFTIATAPGCPWNAYSHEPEWLRFPTSSGTGNGTISTQFDPLPADASPQAVRYGQINIAGNVIPISQRAASCTYSFSPAAIASGPEGGQRTVQVITGEACAWSVVSNDPWITFTGQTSGSLSGTLRLNVQPSTSVRNGSVTLIPGVVSSTPPSVTLTITQTPAAACTYALPSSFLTVPGTATVRSFPVTTQSGCPLSATTSTPWIHLIFSEAGFRDIPFSVDANPSGQTRRGEIQIAGLTYTVEQLGNPAAGLAFFPLPPCRIMDTRPEEGFTGEHGPPAIFLAPRSVAVTGRCGVPPTAHSVALNITTIPLSPPLTNFVMSFFGSTVTNLSLTGRETGVVAGLHVVPTPAVSFSASSLTHVVVDVTGYFAERTVITGLAFYPTQPCRLHDTRNPGNTPIPGATSRIIPAAGQCGIPANATALSLNLAAIPRGPLDFLTLYPTGQPRPIASTLNAYDGQIIANAALIPTGTNGSVSLFASRETDAILDVNGYFAPPSPNGLYFTMVPKCRYADSRTSAFATLAPGTVHTYPNTCDVPTQARAYLLHAAAIPATQSLAFLSLFPAPNWPLVSTLNAYHGRITANTAIVPNNGSGIGVLVSDPANVVLDLYGFFTP